MLADCVHCGPGACGLVVRRHGRHRAAGPHPLLREAEQSGQRLHGPEASGECKLTALVLAPLCSEQKWHT